MAISSEGATEFAAPYPVVFDAVCRAAQAEGMTVVGADPATGVVRVSAGMSAFSWGENADVHVWGAGEGRTGVQVRSALKFGLVDWGRNKRNIDRLFARVGDVLAAGPPPPPPAGWHPDPTGRHELRYWDGAAWSSHVSDAGVTASDPV
jgi:hypothetical protein